MNYFISIVSKLNLNLINNICANVTNLMLDHDGIANYPPPYPAGCRLSFKYYAMQIVDAKVQLVRFCTYLQSNPSIEIR